MTLAATFLGGAKSRLLPPSVPFRFFAAAAVFHVLLWLVLLLAAGNATSFAGGYGPVLAAVHLLTLGVLTTTAIGAATQILSVATRRTLTAVWLVKLVFWLTVPGMMVLIAGMYTAQKHALLAGAGATAAGLVLFAWLLADNLRHAGSLPVVAAHGWAALASLIGLAGLGIALAFNYQFGILHNHAAVALAHMLLGGFGFMGLLVLGFSHILVPMFALASAPAKRPSFATFAAAIAALALGTLGALAGSRVMLASAALIGLAAAGGYLWLMYRVLATGMRKSLGLSFVLVRVAWIMLPITLLVGLAAVIRHRRRQWSDSVRLPVAVRLASHLLVRHPATHLAVSRLDVCYAAGQGWPGDRLLVCRFRTAQASCRVPRARACRARGRHRH